MNAEVSCLNTKAILDYLSRRSIDPRPFLTDLSPELDLLDDPLAYLSDRNNWVSAAVVSRLFARLRQDLGDEQLAFKIGYESVVHRRFGYIQNIFLRLFLTPAQGLSKAQEINDRFNRTKRVELVELTEGKAVVRLTWHAGMDHSKDICLYNQGIYSAIIQVWGMKPASVTETQCAFDGGQLLRIPPALAARCPARSGSSAGFSSPRPLPGDGARARGGQGAALPEVPGGPGSDRPAPQEDPGAGNHPRVGEGRRLPPRPAGVAERHHAAHDLEPRLRPRHHPAPRRGGAESRHGRVLRRRDRDDEAVRRVPGPPEPHQQHPGAEFQFRQAGAGRRCRAARPQPGKMRCSRPSRRPRSSSSRSSAAGR